MSKVKTYEVYLKEKITTRKKDIKYTSGKQYGIDNATFNFTAEPCKEPYGDVAFTTGYDNNDEYTSTFLMTAEDAFELLNANAELINVHNLDVITRDYFSNIIPISEICLEYKVMRNDSNYVISPIWRFVVGETDEQRLMYRDVIIAVDALTGEIIIETRGLKM